MSYYKPIHGKKKLKSTPKPIHEKHKRGYHRRKQIKKLHPVHKRSVRRRKKRSFLLISEIIFGILIVSLFILFIITQYNGGDSPVTKKTDKVVVSVTIDTKANAQLNKGLRNEIESILREGFSIALPQSEFQVRPGDQFSLGFGVTNRMSRITNFQVFFNGLYARYGEANYGRINTEKWISPTNGPFHMTPGKSYISASRITVPSNAAKGKYTFDMYVCFEDFLDEDDFPDAGCNQQYRKKYSQTKKIVIEVV